jgi:3-phenylpropionate/cinnamic acid dioxygenase small subunit
VFDATAVRHEIEDLYRREVMLLQNGRYEEWLSTFTADLRYRAPVVRVADSREDVVAGPTELAYFDENRTTLEVRARKLTSTMAWTEYPPSRLRYLIQVLEVAPAGEDGEVEAQSNFVVYQTRHDSTEHLFFGLRVDRLRREDGGWRVAERRIELDRSRLASENLSLFF